jgi:3-deoxy-manno-octulosonate cytidylyltransferase (CMP-KDO synthetase)
MSVLGIIPARYASSRFPAKALANIEGKSMIQWVYEQARASPLDNVVVATDDSRIFDHVKSFGGEACMTSTTHVSGTDRCFEALTKQKSKYNYVVNIQGDEPFVSPQQIALLTSMLDGQTELATLVKRITNDEQLFNPNVVKVVKGSSNEALYFSRSPIPHVRNVNEWEWIERHAFYKHLGLYAYRTDVLERITKLEVSSLERAESLEQLRWLENGFRVKVMETDLETIGVDTPDDLQKAIAFAKSRKG